MVSSYENVIYTIDYSSLNNIKNIDYLKKNSLILYLKLSENEFNVLLDNDDSLSNSEKILLKSVFNDRDFISGKICDLAVICKNLSSDIIVKIVLDAVKEFLENKKAAHV